MQTRVTRGCEGRAGIGPSAAGDLKPESTGAQIERGAGGPVGRCLIADRRSRRAPADRCIEGNSNESRGRVAGGGMCVVTIARERQRRDGGRSDDPARTADHLGLGGESAGRSARTTRARRAAILERHIRRARDRRQACQKQTRTDNRQGNYSSQHDSPIANDPGFASSMLHPFQLGHPRKSRVP